MPRSVVSLSASDCRVTVVESPSRKQSCFRASVVNTPVEAMQVAPSVLKALGLDPNELQSVQQEGTGAMPATQF
jgi:hypothetical protein